MLDFLLLIIINKRNDLLTNCDHTLLIYLKLCMGKKLKKRSIAV